MPAQITSLEMRGITKRFPGVMACKDVDLTIYSGEILALLGENGAGKSSLMNVLYGLYAQDEGHIFINGQKTSINSPCVAFDLGIGMVHQHFMLVPNLTVTENVALGLCSDNIFKLDLPAAKQRILDVAQKHGLHANPDAYIWQLSVGEQQRVELIKILALGANLLILDEPTAALTPQETDELLKILRDMAQKGCSIIFISHKLNEIRRVSDRIQVLRGGESVFTGEIESISDNDLAQHMAGCELDAPAHRIIAERSSNITLNVTKLCAKNDINMPCLEDISFAVHEGEILGIAGVSGNGQRELAQCLARLRPVTSGKIEFDHTDITHDSVSKAILKGLSYVPEDRTHEGTIPSFSVRENLILKDYDSPRFSHFSWLRLQVIEDFAHQMVKHFTIRTPSLDTSCASLSGGNIQKVILAREMSRNPKLLIAAYPIRGLDLGATEYVHKQFLKLSHNGGAVILISEELDELLAMCDRIAVMYHGRIIDIVDAHTATKQALGLLMAGIRRDPSQELQEEPLERTPYV